MSVTDVSNSDFLKNIKIKQEKLSPPPASPKTKTAESTKTNPRDSNEKGKNDESNSELLVNIKKEKNEEENTETEQKPSEPLKSSSELLAELFKVFNSVPPDSLEFKSKKSKKKHKKHKKKHKKRGRSSSDEDNESDEDTKKKAKKRKKSKSRKSEERETRISKKSEKNTDKNNDKESIIIKKEKCTEESDRREHRRHTKSKKSHKGSDLDIEEYENRLLKSNDAKHSSTKEKDTKSSSVSKKGKIIIKDLKNSAVYAESVSQAKEKLKDEDGEISDSGSSKSSSISLSDEETYLKNKEKYYGRSSSYYRDRHDDWYDRRHRNRDCGGKYSRRSERSRRYSRSRSRSRSRRRDNSEDRIDKKRLLEIARKNAILMFKNGMLPGVQNMAPEVKERILTKMRYGGKTVDELTEFCKKLSNGESSGYLSNISDDSDHDREGNEKAFSHPFVLKDRGPIVMNIKNSTPIPPKSAEQTKAILLQFPVSSGQHHRNNESEWVPVSPKKIKAPKVVTKPADVPVTAAVAVTVVKETALEPSVIEPEKPDVASSVFKSLSSSQSFDVSSIISSRLSAMRKLQDNPLDHEAIKTMYTTQKDMSAWANSKFVPGQFTGSTGANILTPKELTSGFQAWAKCDQMLTSAPLSGGMGMHILQKMGWKPGEGLGKERNGSLQPLLLKVKLDKKGLLANEEDGNPQVRRKRPTNVAQAKESLQNKHPVSLLGELAAKRKWLSPLYEQVYEGGPSHGKKFSFRVSINGNNFITPNPCNNKKEAKAAAARFALQEMGVLQ